MSHLRFTLVAIALLAACSSVDQSPGNVVPAKRNVSVRLTGNGSGQLTIARSDWCGEIGSPKGGKTRRVPMTKRLAEALSAIRHLRGPRALYQRDGEPVTETTLRSWMERAERAGGLPVTGHIHRLRHTFCSHLAMRGAPAKAIQELSIISPLERISRETRCPTPTETWVFPCTEAQEPSATVAGHGVSP